MKVYGHRGAAGEAPENTIAGCLHGLSRGAEYFEIDLRLSSDRQFVIHHDATVDRTTYGRGAIEDFTAAQLAGLDARRSGPPWPDKKNCGIPTLDAFLEATSEAKGYFLELKTDRNSPIADIATRISQRFATEKSVEKCVVMSMNIKLLHKIRAIAPHIPLGFIAKTGDIVRKLNDYKFEHLSMHWASCNPMSIMMIRRKGIELSSWTVNDPQVITGLRKLKIDNVITDYPSMAVPLVASLERE